MPDELPSPEQPPVGTIVLEISMPPDVTPADCAAISRAISKRCRSDRGETLFYQRVPPDVDAAQLLQFLTSAGLPVHGIRRSPRL